MLDESREEIREKDRGGGENTRGEREKRNRKERSKAIKERERHIGRAIEKDKGGRPREE